MKKALILISSLLVIVSLIMSFLIVNLVEKGITGSAIDTQIREYTYTKAICDENKCQDYVISCSGNNEVSRIPITGAMIQIDSEWEDPRSQEVINTFCQD